MLALRGVGDAEVHTFHVHLTGKGKSKLAPDGTARRVLKQVQMVQTNNYNITSSQAIPKWF